MRVTQKRQRSLKRKMARAAAGKPVFTSEALLVRATLNDPARAAVRLQSIGLTITPVTSDQIVELAEEWLNEVD